jgi:hypothetical protein
MKTEFVCIKKEISEILINQLIDHPEFNKEKFLKTNPQLKEVVEKAIKEREDRKKYGQHDNKH